MEGDSYSIGDVGQGAQVAQGRDIGQRMVVTGGLPAQMKDEFAKILADIERDASLSSDERQEATSAVAAVINAATAVAEDPSRLEAALHEVQRVAAGVWDRVRGVFTSDAGKQLLNTIASTATKAAIETLLAL